jgi:hypothetical protein
MSNQPNGMSAIDQAGSIASGLVNPNDLGGGNMRQPNEPQVDMSKYVEKAVYDGLQTKLGEQGTELGELRGFYESIGPLLSKLEESPEIVEAILQGKIDSALVKSITDGTISAQGAQAVTQAHEEVKNELGNKAYDKATPDQLAKMIEDRAMDLRREMDGKLKEVEDVRAFEAEVNNFIAETPDFETYSKQVSSWLDKHQEVTDIKVAYYAVKGELSEGEAKAKAAVDQAEYAKNMALNAGGGGSNGGIFPEGVNAADALISGLSNPNNIF